MGYEADFAESAEPPVLSEVMSLPLGPSLLGSINFVDPPLLVLLATFVFLAAPIAGIAGVVLFFDGLTRRTAKGFDWKMWTRRSGFQI